MGGRREVVRDIVGGKSLRNLAKKIVNHAINLQFQ